MFAALLMHAWPYAAQETLPAELGLDISTGFQSDPLSPSTIAAITSSSPLSTVRHFKFFGWDSDHAIAAAILNASSNPEDITFYIGIPNSVGDVFEALNVSNIAALVAEWDDLKDNVYAIALTNEPGNIGTNFSLLPPKLEMVYSYLQSQNGWEHVHVSIPFCCIFGVTYPVPDSAFKAEYRAHLAELIDIYQRYGGVFSVNMYPFYVTEHEPQLLSYILGEEALEYSSMLAAQYVATWYAMQEVAPNNSVEIIISETGWSTSSPSFDFATLENAKSFYNNTFRQMKDPETDLYGVRIYAFELFDENLKYGGDWEPYFGLYDLQAMPKWNLLPTQQPTTAPTLSMATSLISTTLVSTSALDRKSVV